MSGKARTSLINNIHCEPSSPGGWELLGTVAHGAGDNPSPADDVNVFDVWTVNCNTWSTMQSLIEAQEFETASVLCIQETKLPVTGIDTAVQWMLARGWCATFSPAIATDSGGLSGGVAIAVRAGLNIGVSALKYNIPEEHRHRVIGVRLVADGLVPVAVMSVYFQDGLGPKELNLDLLSDVALVQEVDQLPVLAGCDFNMTPSRVTSLDFCRRSSTTVMAPGKATYFHNKTARILDYFLLSQCLGPAVDSVRVQHEARLSPHRPVRLRANLSGERLVPVLQMPQKLPTASPVGPRPEPGDWEELHRTMLGLREVVTKGVRLTADDSFSKLPYPDRQRHLDSAYAQLVGAIERELSRATDTPLRNPGYRASPPHIKMVPARIRCSTHLQAWRAYGTQYRWLLNKLHEAQACLQEGSLSWMAEIVGEAGQIPEDFLGAPMLLEAHERVLQLLAALHSDWKTGVMDQRVGFLAIGQVQTDLEDLLVREKARGRQASETSWRQWVRGSSLSWQHKWTKEQGLAWRPVAGQDGACSGKPTALLQKEADRLSALWDVSSEPLHPLEFAVADLPDITLDEFQAAMNRFGHRTAQTFDGLHPKHYQLLTPDQQQVVIEFLHCIERHGNLPTQIQCCVTCLIPKQKSAAAAFRGIGLLPSLYRAWARMRQGYVRDWESQHLHPVMGHQKGRSITEIIYVQAARQESQRWTDSRVHTATLLWDMSNYYEHLNRDLLLQRSSDLDFPMALARVSCNVYQSARIVSLQGYSVRVGQPQRGIPAGCGYATFYVQCYSLRPMLNWQARHQSVSGSLFIDDITAGTMGISVGEVVSNIVGAARDLSTVVADELECSIAVSKCQLVCSSDTVQAAIVQKLGDLSGGQHRTSSAKNLGVDFFWRRPAKTQEESSQSEVEDGQFESTLQTSAQSERCRCEHETTVHHRPPTVWVLWHGCCWC